VDLSCGVVVTGGQHEGWLRVHDVESGAVLARVPRCGDVKDLVIHDGGLLFASLCGAFRVDLDAILEAAR
jgi:hypothetical protein